MDSSSGPTTSQIRDLGKCLVSHLYSRNPPDVPASQGCYETTTMCSQAACMSQGGLEDSEGGKIKNEFGNVKKKGSVDKRGRNGGRG